MVGKMPKETSGNSSFILCKRGSWPWKKCRLTGVSLCCFRRNAQWHWACKLAVWSFLCIHTDFLISACRFGWYVWFLVPQSTELCYCFFQVHASGVVLPCFKYVLPNRCHIIKYSGSPYLHVPVLLQGLCRAFKRNWLWSIFCYIIKHLKSS